MDRVFVYWDNSNIFDEAQRPADEREDTPNARYLVRVHFDNLLRLAAAERPLARQWPPDLFLRRCCSFATEWRNRGIDVTSSATRFGAAPHDRLMGRAGRTPPRSVGTDLDNVGVEQAAPMT